MIATILPCEKCGRVEVTGDLKRIDGKPNVRLCALHFAEAISSQTYHPNVDLIRREMKRSLLKQSEYLSPKGIDLKAQSV
jgi:hypothetical protein